MNKKIISHFIALPVFMTVVVLIGMFIGINNPPGEWYAQLNKPSFTPPNWLFAPVWSILYIVIAWVGWRTWLKHSNAWVWYLWIAQLMVNFMWSPLFFGAHQIGVALIILLLTTALVILFIFKQWSLDKLSAIAFIPYVLWLGFACVLNASIWWLN